MLDTTEIQKKTLLCYQCSKCNSVCPAFRTGQFSPRAFVLETVSGGVGSVVDDPTIWGCQTCGACDVCPMGIDIPGAVLATRSGAVKAGNVPPPTKSGHRRIFHMAQRIQARSPTPPVANAWPRNNQKFSERGKVGLYAGILPVWDALMYNFEMNFTPGLQAVLESLNIVDVEPAIPAGFKDSGHDLFYGGNEGDFIELAKHNQAIMERSGIETLIVVNPEDYHVLKHVYPRYLDGFSPELVFWTDVLVKENFIERLRYQAYLDVEVIAAYHDPCKLGRLNSIYESPRVILENLPGVRLKALTNEKEHAPCCGVTAFIGCDDASLYLRQERLREAIDAGVEVLVTTCPSCVSHYHCATLSLGSADSPSKPVSVEDLSAFMAKRLYHFSKGTS